MDIRINELDPVVSPTPGLNMAVDGVTMGRMTIAEVVDIGRPLASQAEAEAGVQATKAMTPLTTAQAIDAQAATTAQGALADSAVQPADLAQVATSGDYDDLLNQPNLSSDLIYPVKADAVAATVPAAEHALKLNGSVAVGDGDGGLYIDTNNGNADTFVSGDGRTWYRAQDINTDRLIDEAITEPKLAAAIAALINGAAQKAQNLNDLADKASARLNLKVSTYVADRTALKALDTTKDTTAYNKEAGRLGDFDFDSANLSAKITADTQEIGFVAPTADPTGATGAWRRNLKMGRIFPEDGGVTGDGVSSANNLTRMQAAIDFAAREKKVLELTPGGDYRIPGPMLTKSGTYIVGAPGAILRPTEWSVLAGGFGGFLGNVGAYDDIVLEGLHVDGQYMPANAYGLATAGTATTVTLGAWADGKVRVGDPVTFIYGTSFGRTSFVQSWNAGTRVLTMTTSGAVADATTFIGLGSNDNIIGFASGGSRVRILGGYFENMLAQWTGGGSGGKAVNFEQGCTNCQALDYVAYRMGFGGFAQGVDGAGLQAVEILMRYTAIECGAAFMAAGHTAATDPDGDNKDSWMRAEVDFTNCGFQPYRPVAATQTKSAPIVFGEAQNVTVKARGRTTSDYAPSFPAAGTGFVGSGLVGNPIGRVITGWGRNLNVDVEYSGAVDALYTLETPRASGVDGAPSGVPQNCFDLDFKIKHRGTAPTNLFDQRQTLGTPVDAAKVSGRFEVDCNYYPTSILTSDMAYVGLWVDVNARTAAAITERGVKGGADLVRTLHNSLSAVAGKEDLTGVQYFTMLDDTAASFTPERAVGTYAYASVSGDLRGYFTYSTSSPQCRVMTGPLLTLATTGVLTGTTGTDTNFIFSAFTDGKIYLENRRGSTLAIKLKPVVGL